LADEEVTTIPFVPKELSKGPVRGEPVQPGAWPGR